MVEVAPNADPPVCRILDLGKYIFEQNKKERQARKAQTKIEVKEIRLRPKTNEHHRSFKVRDARRWLEEGMKVKVTIRFRGREVTYPEIALEDLREIAEELKDISKVEAAFIRILLGIYHQRIDYPRQEGGGLGEISGTDRR